MPDYCAYLLDKDGHIQRRIDLDCTDDSAAIDRARQLVDGHDVELWQRARRVTILKHQEK